MSKNHKESPNRHKRLPTVPQSFMTAPSRSRPARFVNSGVHKTDMASSDLPGSVQSAYPRTFDEGIAPSCLNQARHPALFYTRGMKQAPQYPPGPSQPNPRCYIPYVHEDVIPAFPPRSIGRQSSDENMEGSPFIFDRSKAQYTPPGWTQIPPTPQGPSLSTVEGAPHTAATAPSSDQESDASEPQYPANVRERRNARRMQPKRKCRTTPYERVTDHSRTP